jgi:hypothetical protein
MRYQAYLRNGLMTERIPTANCTTQNTTTGRTHG